MAFFTEKNLRGYHFKLYPDLQEFVNTTKALNSSNFWDYIPQFKKLLKSNFISDFLATELQKMDEMFDYDFLNQDVGIDIIKLPEYTLTLGKLFESTFLGGNRPEVVGFGSDMMFCNLGPGTLEVEIYEFPCDHPLEVFDKTKTITLKNRLFQNKGDIIKLRAGKDIIKILNVNETAFQLYLVSSDIQDLVWHYDEKTLRPLYATAGKSQTSRIQCMLMMLANLGSKQSIPLLKKLATAKQHFLRWSAIKTITALSPEDGYPLLKEAMHDPHPHVRNASKTTLQLLENPN